MKQQYHHLFLVILSTQLLIQGEFGLPHKKDTCNFQRFKKFKHVNIIMKVQQLICDNCKVVLLEKDSQHLDNERFPITDEEAKLIDKEHRGHECHIELVEKF